jgi:hypothetical protein
MNAQQKQEAAQARYARMDAVAKANHPQQQLQSSALTSARFLNQVLYELGDQNMTIAEFRRGLKALPADALMPGYQIARLAEAEVQHDS